MGRTHRDRQRSREVSDSVLTLRKGFEIVADLTKQAPNNSYAPPTVYRDVEFKCIDCGREQIWTAEEQQWWYEVAKGAVQSRAVRCRKCRVARRDRPHGGTSQAI